LRMSTALSGAVDGCCNGVPPGKGLVFFYRFAIRDFQ
jgi:hypothetical protein